MSCPQSRLSGECSFYGAVCETGVEPATDGSLNRCSAVEVLKPKALRCCQSVRDVATRHPRRAAHLPALQIVRPAREHLALSACTKTKTPETFGLRGSNARECVCASYRGGGASPSSLPVNPACGYTAGAEPGNGLVTFESRCRCVLNIRYAPQRRFAVTRRRGWGNLSRV